MIIKLEQNSNQNTLKSNFKQNDSLIYGDIKGPRFNEFMSKEATE